MNKHSKNERKIGKNILKLVIIALFVLAIIIIFHIASNNYVIDDIKGKTNLIINNTNVTKNLKADVYIQNNVVYISQSDIKNFFDNSIIYDEQYNQLITCAEKKVATLPIGVNKIELNSASINIKSGVIEKDGIYYVPISELGNVYNTQTSYNEGTNIVTVDSLDKAYIVATLKKDISVKFKPTGISKTVAKVKKGDTLIIANRSDYPVPNGWTRVRTEDGILGYAKINTMGENVTIREEIQKSVENNKVSLIWDYFSSESHIPDRSGTQIKGINVISPTFFRLKEAGKGEINVHIGEKGKEYIKWAHEQGYKIWPSFSNESLGDTTASIVKDYKLREKMINQIIDNIVTYNLDGINIDFENMYQADKDNFSRFLIELEPRLNEIGAILSVDVTAPDGAPNWSLCYDRHTISKVSDYIIFMAYDQYGISSTKQGTTAGCNWVENNIQKFLGQEDVQASKLVLGIPFYTRIWWEDSKGNVKSSAVGIKDLKEKIPNDAKKEWDDDLKQYIVQYKKNGIEYKVWLEDEESLKAKLQLISQYNLIGAAYWRKGYETNEVLNLISNEINK